MEASSKTRREQLRALQRDPEAALEIGMNVLRALVDHDRAEVYIVGRGTVRTKPVRCGDQMDVKGGG